MLELLCHMAENIINMSSESAVVDSLCPRYSTSHSFSIVVFALLVFSGRSGNLGLIRVNKTHKP